ncbi:lysylphosphatidylglycerol synthase transmembrane domain-containing protein [Saccharopolyspora sp. MS10]|uniref:lysylphosphatidylglycerol synthase transmembrane domain-containing protein n=1 Tax=Saccharopolyspora sp. MS10 TaxID=3385973 RepID=UPI0039A31422
MNRWPRRTEDRPPLRAQEEAAPREARADGSSGAGNASARAAEPPGRDIPELSGRRGFSPAPSADRAVARGRGRKAWRALASWGVALIGLGLLAWQLPAATADARGLGFELASLRTGWVGIAILLGTGALVLYGESHRVLLRTGGARLRFGTVQAVNFAENALSTTLPGVGNAAGFAYATYRLRQLRVTVALAAWSSLLAGIVAMLTLLVLGLLGLGWSGQVSGFIAAPAAVAVLLAAWGAWALLGRAPAGRRGSTSAPAGRSRAARAWHELSGEVLLWRPSRRRWIAVFFLAAMSWTLDIASLFASIAATGHLVPWAALVTGFLVVQASIALQVFPGGAGPAEAGLFGVLVAFGLPAAPAAAAVLVYRLISWVWLAVLGWIVYLAQSGAGARTRGTPRRRRADGRARSRKSR